MRPLLVTHCGAGSTYAVRDAAEAAGAAGMKVLRRGGSALDAVEAAIIVLEDDPRTNAGTGSRMRLDGSIQMDAALMDSRQRIGAVAAIEDVRNPVRVARRVMRTPHVLLAGEWATAFARKEGFPPYDPATERARKIWEEALADVRGGKAPGWTRAWRAHAADTVGAVARDGKGRYAAGSSTGGVAYMLPGRVGDSPIPGAGLYAGTAGAVTATGEGEAIIRVVLCKSVYDQIAERGARAACEAGVRLFPKSVPIGIIAVGKEGAAEASNRPMAWWTNVWPSGHARLRASTL